MEARTKVKIPRKKHPVALRSEAEHARDARIKENTAIYRFKPGQSGNPLGRPKLCANWRPMLIVQAQKPLPKDHKWAQYGKTFGEAFVRRVFELAMDGEAQYAQMLMDRTDGKVAQIVGEDKENPFQNILTSIKVRAIVDNGE